VTLGSLGEHSGNQDLCKFSHDVWQKPPFGSLQSVTITAVKSAQGTGQKIATAIRGLCGASPSRPTTPSPCGLRIIESCLTCPVRRERHPLDEAALARLEHDFRERRGESVPLNSTIPRD